MNVELNYKALKFLVEALDTQIASIRQRLAAGVGDDEAADLGNDLGYLKALRAELDQKGRVDASQSIAVERAAALQLQFWQQVIAAALVAGLVVLAFKRPGPVLGLSLPLLLAAVTRRRVLCPHAGRCCSGDGLAAGGGRGGRPRRAAPLRRARAAAQARARTGVAASRLRLRFQCSNNRTAN
jgi:hypothetical protein